LHDDIALVPAGEERRVGAILRESCPGVVVSLSSEVAPEFREYRRASTTIINAGLQPLVARYLHNIETRLREKGFASDFLVMQSSGGVFGAKAAAAKPVFMVESGPAAGVMAATYLGATLGHANVISFDMGYDCQWPSSKTAHRASPRLRSCPRQEQRAAATAIPAHAGRGSAEIGAGGAPSPGSIRAA
jgi:hypothetical protein